MAWFLMDVWIPLSLRYLMISLIYINLYIYMTYDDMTCLDFD